MFLVVAILLATLTYQTPTEAGSSYHQIPPFNKTVGSSNNPKIIYLSKSNTTLACEHKAWIAIAL